MKKITRKSPIVFALLTFSLFFISFNSKAQCLYIESILVDACNKTPCPGTATEGENEMVLFKVGSTPLTIAYTTTVAAVLTPNWPNNSFKGWQVPGAITNPIVAALNTTIIKCGFLKEPVAGVLPANSQVLIITSTNMCTAGNSFANLTDTLYVLFQIAGNTQGHFANNDNSSSITTVPTGSVSPRTFTLAYTGVPSCSESVTYDRSLLVNDLGTYGGGAVQNDGSAVNYDAAGTATYVNNGCKAPYIPISITATAPSTVCVNASPNINAIISGPAVTYTWSTSGTGSMGVPTGTLSGSGSATVAPSYTPGAGESGTVTFTITAQGKCLLDILTNTVSINVIALPSPVIASSSGTVICNGSSTVLSVASQSGVGYAWNPGGGSGTSFTVAPSAQTIYTLTATNSCAAIPATFTVDVNPLPVVSVASASICPGFTATITVSGASTYTWNTGPIAGSISDSPAITTTYTATGTDGNGCIGIGTGTITVYNTPTVTVNSPATCVGGTVTLNAGGASTFTWSTTQNGNSISVSPASSVNYTVTGTDANGCDNFAVSAVTINPLPTVSVPSQTICPGNTATLTATGATTYTWNTTATGASITDNPAINTSYTVTGTDINGCVNTASASIAVVNSVTVSAVPASTVVCNGSSTTITASGAGTYTWSSAATLSSSTGTTVTASPTSNTTYTVVGSSGSCKDSSMVTVNVNNLPTVAGASTQSVVCNGSSVTLTGSGAQTYTWTGGVTDGTPFTPASTQTYTVTGTDINGCINSSIVTVTVTTLTVTATSSAPSVCIGSSATLTANGATNYTWSPAGTLSSANGTTVTATPSSTVATTYTVVGATGLCSATGTVSFIVNPLPVVTANTTTTSICNGGSVTLTGGGASVYVWTGGVSNGIAFNPTSTQTYTVAGLDANGCSNFASVSVTVNNLPTVSGASTASVVCGGSSVTLTGSGAQTYTWTGGVTNGVPFTPSSTQTYTVTGTDLNGCNNISTVNVTVTNLTVTATSSAPSVCIGSSATLTANGATNYTWSPATTLSSANGTTVTATPTSTTSITYTVVGTTGACSASNTVSLIVNPLPVITANTSTTSICNGGSVTLSGGGGLIYVWTGGVPNNIPFNPTTTQTYSVAGLDMNGCSGFAAVTVTVNPTPIITVNSGTICAGSPTTLTATGASTYTWSTTQNGNSIVVSPASGTSYTVTGTDALGCVGVQTTSVTVNSLPNVVATSTAVCTGTSAIITASGALTYVWSTTQTTPSITVPSTAASYTVTGTDANGCVKSAVSVVSLNPTPTITVNNPSICLGNSATLTANGAATYTWIPAATGSSINVSPSSNTTYTVMGTDVNGCLSNVATAIVAVNSLPNAAFSASTLNGQVPALINFTNASSGTNPLFNYWSFGNGDSSLLVNSAETYTTSGTYNVILTVVDANGCKDTAKVTIVVADFPIVIPNVFSPNGDNINDMFSISAFGISNFDCKIYDRWGIFLYEWTDVKGGWDGRNSSNGNHVTDGTYYFILSYKDDKSKAVSKQGYLQLVR